MPRYALNIFILLYFTSCFTSCFFFSFIFIFSFSFSIVADAFEIMLALVRFWYDT